MRFSLLVALAIPLISLPARAQTAESALHLGDWFVVRQTDMDGYPHTLAYVEGIRANLEGLAVTCGRPTAVVWALPNSAPVATRERAAVRLRFDDGETATRHWEFSAEGPAVATFDEREVHWFVEHAKSATKVTAKVEIAGVTVTRYFSLIGFSRVVKQVRCPTWPW